MNHADMLKEYSRYLEIDRHNLDQEVARIPSLFFTVADHWSRAVRKRDILEHELRAIDAKLSEEARERAEDRKEKYTETKIKNIVESNLKRKKANKAFRLAAHRATQWDALKQAYIQKSHALRAAVDLALNESRQNSSITSVSPNGRDAEVEHNRARINERRRPLRHAR